MTCLRTEQGARSRVRRGGGFLYGGGGGGGEGGIRLISSVMPLAAAENGFSVVYPGTYTGDNQ